MAEMFSTLPSRSPSPGAEAKGTAGAAGAAGAAGTAELSIVIPTFKERDNVPVLLQRLDKALAGIDWEAIIVDDDSPDDTATVVKEISRRDPRVRCLRRVNRRGLAGACIEGMLFSAAPFVAVIDADLQHDETVLPRMLGILRSGKKDMVVASRYIDGGNTQSFSKARGAVSRVATILAQRVTGVRLSDPMSGLFMMRRESFDPLADRLSTQGFKILLDIVLTARGRLRIAEEPYSFGARMHGESKLDSQVVLDFLGLLLSKLTGGVVTSRFLSFGFVGMIGLFVHLAVLRMALVVLNLSFPYAQAVATAVAMTGNFLLNNMFTYRDKRLGGWAMLRGLFGFYAISTVGAFANVGLASWLYVNQPVWWLAGAAGALMSVVWNYTMATLFVWRVK